MNRLIRVCALVVPFLLGIFAAYAGEEILPTGPYRNEDAYLDQRYDRTEAISSEYTVGLMRYAEIQFDDRVNDRCLADKDTIVARVKQGLDRSGVDVIDEPLAFYMPLFPLVRIEATGYRTASGVCAVSAHLSVTYEGRNAFGKLSSFGKVYELKSTAIIWSKNGIVADDKNVDGLLKDEVTDWVNELSRDIKLARGNKGVVRLLSAWKNMRPMTEADFQAQFQDVVKQLAK